MSTVTSPSLQIKLQGPKSQGPAAPGTGSGTSVTGTLMPVIRVLGNLGAQSVRLLTAWDTLRPVESAVDAGLWSARQRYLQGYAAGVQQLGVVDYVFYDPAPGDLKVYVVFKGDRWKVRPLLYDLEERLTTEAPHVAADVRYLLTDCTDTSSLKATLRQIYPA